VCILRKSKGNAKISSTKDFGKVKILFHSTIIRREVVESFCEKENPREGASIQFYKQPATHSKGARKEENQGARSSSQKEEKTGLVKSNLLGCPRREEKRGFNFRVLSGTSSPVRKQFKQRSISKDVETDGKKELNRFSRSNTKSRRACTGENREPKERETHGENICLLTKRTQ